MMPRTDGNPLLIQVISNLFFTEAFERERKYSGFFLRGADDVQTRNADQFVCGLFQQRVFVAGNIRHSDAVKIIDGSAKTYSICNISSSCFKSLRRTLVNCPLEGDILDHIAATLPRRHAFQHFRLP